MKKTKIIIGILLGLVGWFFWVKPEPPFGAEQQATYFAEVDANGTVLRVIVADQAFIDSGKVGDPKNWVETTLDGSKGGIYAGKGYKYNKSTKVFAP